MTLDEIEVVLDNALARQAARGVSIVRGEYGVDVGAYTAKVEFENRHAKPCACAFGAWAIDRQVDALEIHDIDDLLRSETRKVFGIDGAEYSAFLNGFDDGDTAYGDPRQRAIAGIGKRLSEKYVGKFDVSEAQ
jgi:hypothetical protein